MIEVEVYACGETADEASAASALGDAKGLDEYHASHPFGLLYWHRRPFTVMFATDEAAARFIDRLAACGYQARRTAPDRLMSPPT
jgi:hypothetical protein